MNFYSVNRDTKVNTSKLNSFFLVSNQWNDFHEYWNMFTLYYVNTDGDQIRLGYTRIARLVDGVAQKVTQLPSKFKSLDATFFSLGSDEQFYENIRDLVEDKREHVHISLNDCCYNLSKFREFENQDVMQRSLLREHTKTKVMGQLHRIALGGVTLTNYNFVFHREISSTSRISLDFQVNPFSKPPSNVHVLIGRNGTGKTSTLKSISQVMLEGDANSLPSKLEFAESNIDDFFVSDSIVRFSNLVSVSFSSFDEQELALRMRDSHSVPYAFIGTSKLVEDSKMSSNEVGKGPGEFKEEFINSAKACYFSQKKSRWRRALSNLESDPVFQNLGMHELFSTKESESGLPSDVDDFAIRVGEIYGGLSSGHKIVLLTITMLVERIEEMSLVLIDEPESHLHPPLLSALIRALSELLMDRNGVAIIATHSPVVLQEVPKSCVWKLNRFGDIASCERPNIETFGENVGVLTREVFGLEVARSGFHSLLQQEIDRQSSIENVIDAFGGAIGSEGRMIAHALFFSKQGQTER